MKKCAIYARVSTTDQRVDNQLYDLRLFALQRGFEVACEYTDVGYSGSKARRPGLDAMLRDARKRKFAVVIVAAFDRMARSVIQRNYRVIVAGPTTLWSILNSLQMGFRTLAIEKRTSEVWNLLAGVKTEWTKYGEVLDSVQKKLNQASETIEKAKVRSRAIGRKLKDVQELPATDATLLLPDSLLTEEAEPTEHEVLEEEEEEEVVN
jgi:hypothetical protein